MNNKFPLVIAGLVLAMLSAGEAAEHRDHSTIGDSASTYAAARPLPPPVSLHAPITITITSGDITLIGGTLMLGPDGRTYQGALRIGNASVNFEDKPVPQSKPR